MWVPSNSGYSTILRCRPHKSSLALHEPPGDHSLWSHPTLSCHHSLSGDIGQALSNLAGEHTSKTPPKRPCCSQDGRSANGPAHIRNPQTGPASLTTLSPCRTEMSLRQREWCGTSERDAPMGREEERAEVGMSLIQAPGTVASSNNSPLCWLSHFSLPRWGHFIMHRPVPLRAVSLLRLSCARILV